MPRMLLAIALLALAAGGLAACGDDENETPSGASATEAAFLRGMIPHHESAVEMAEIARDRGEHPEVKELARAITTAQNAEITQMEQIYTRLTGEEILPDPAAHEKLGLSQDEAGMHEGGAMTLDDATKDFDRAFIDEMIPHHQGAIRQARIVLADTQDDEVHELANGIVSAQSREIEEMNRWRRRGYGSPAPAGGVPSENEELPPAGEDGGERDSGH